MQHINVQVTLEFHILRPEGEDPTVAAKSWVDEIDRVVFKDEINYGNYKLEATTVICDCDKEV
ncbi:hypothetical protein LCGC14_2745670 [marine sediment metagenome]|uniref:Uncharacterized protein n=1 Tax=marine sediment metagenome TaxID=412755 RepID=A0A0F8ZQA7_9ZZZZ